MNVFSPLKNVSYAPGVHGGSDLYLHSLIAKDVGFYSQFEPLTVPCHVRMFSARGEPIQLCEDLTFFRGKPGPSASRFDDGIYRQILDDIT